MGKRIHGFEPKIKVWKTLVLPLHHIRKLWEISLPATSFTPRNYKIYEIKSQDPYIRIEPISAVYKTAASPQCLYDNFDFNLFLTTLSLTPNILPVIEYPFLVTRIFNSSLLVQLATSLLLVEHFPVPFACSVVGITKRGVATPQIYLELTKLLILVASDSIYS